MHELKLDPIQIKLQRLKSNTSYIFTVFFLSFKKKYYFMYCVYKTFTSNYFTIF